MDHIEAPHSMKYELYENFQYIAEDVLIWNEDEMQAMSHRDSIDRKKEVINKWKKLVMKWHLFASREKFIKETD